MKGPIVLYVASLLLALFWFLALALNILFTSSKPSPILIMIAAAGIVLAKLWGSRIKKAEVPNG